MTAPTGDADSGDQGQAATDPKPFAPITSQEDLDRVLGSRLAQKERAVRAEFEGFDDLKAKAEQYDQLQAANQSEAERLQAERDAAIQAAQQNEARAKSAELAATRQRVAIEEGLDPKFASRLSGESEDEIRADAKEVFAEFIKPATPSFDHGPRSTSAPQSMNDLLFGSARRR